MWTSKHIFIHDYKLVDVFLKEKLLPLINQCALDKWFFIRYWQGGPHIRLRYKIKELQVKHVFEKELEDTLRDFQLEYQNEKFSEVSYDDRVVQLEGVKDLKVYPNFSIQDILYVPEVARYGGEEAVSFSEELFSYSSELASYVIQEIAWPKRYIIAFDVMFYSYKMAEKLGIAPAREVFFSSYNQVWSSFKDREELSKIQSLLQTRLEQLENKESIPKVYNNYFESMENNLKLIMEHQNIYTKETIYYILISHIHMLNNRLGLSPQNEYLLSRVFLKKGDYSNEVMGL
ncbi:TPA: thiopeptide-type bacteriocin biosynthesis protein [Bacillus tropicus]|uniref:Thiopeptide-type bacteriocin biosynthesis protein n=1 Tax=Bacillus tropicus TaxID=2026188 RepID=A0ABD7ZPA5_9BACI|nr:thiopeptide-type bacteriocin biosynthesis protein [Bacillus tropicus]AIY78388.1 thiopeptide-type bacteriocin biosynthesis domain protein [Bacillus cereus]AJI03182.1 thiopeptide-type bacteriocin biosynthesis domain protein [Bacillus cereus G9241]PEF68029.1 lantibiotic biosynthesis protein [Bacillus anthracis]AJG92769.1 thiopeptide-type bacteriocin biosynthesis domain protein [Bacillus cereus]ARO16535.1 lantibiotic biosynthesis protein [Bacillus cereus]